MSSWEIQQKRKQEKKEYYEKHPNKKEKYFDEYNVTWIILGSFVFVFIIGLLWISTITNEDNKNNCEKVGGKYIIVDRTFTGKTAVDIYGCVK